MNILCKETLVKSLVNCYLPRDSCEENDASFEESANDISCKELTEIDTSCEESGNDADCGLITPERQRTEITVTATCE